MRRCSLHEPVGGKRLTEVWSSQQEFRQDWSLGTNKGKLEGLPLALSWVNERDIHDFYLSYMGKGRFFVVRMLGEHRRVGRCLTVTVFQRRGLRKSLSLLLHFICVS